MKKMLSYAMIFVLSLMMLSVPSFESFAADLSMSVSSSSVDIGDTVKVTVTAPSGTTATVDVYFPTDVFEYAGATGTTNAVGGTVTTTLGEPFSSSVTVTLKAKTSGTATISAKAIKAGDSATGDVVSVGGASKSVTVNNQTPPDTGNEGGAGSEGGQGGQGGEGGGGTTTTPEPPKSGDNSLSSLKLSSGKLSPSFKYNVTKYTATVEYDVTEVTIDADTSHKEATVSISGDETPVKLDVGKNTIEIVVKAPNGVTATYRIVVTRKAQETTVTPQPSESESNSNSESESGSNSESESQSTVPEVNELFMYNGEKLQVPEKIPAESIPTNFESTLLVVNGQQMQGLSFTKGDLKVLYLNNSNGAGSLYVYDELLNMIYPFVKLTSEKSYVMVLMPDDLNAPAPEGFESCTFSIEGKGIVNAFQMKEDVSTEDATMSWNLFGPETFYAAEAIPSDFYLIYCMNDAGEKGWYMYDVVEGTFQRYLAAAPTVEVGGDVPSTEDTNVEDVQNIQNIQSKYEALQKELNDAKMAQYIIIAIAAAVVFILVIVIIVLATKKRDRKDEDFFEEYDDDDDDEEEVDEDDYDDIKAYAAIKKVEDVEDNEDDIEDDIEDMDSSEVAEQEEVVEDTEDTEDTEVMEEIKVTEVFVEDEDEEEIEIEFYEMETEESEEQTEETEESGIEFYNMEELIVNEVEETEIKIKRRPRLEDPTSKLLTKKEDDDDLEFIDFE